MLLTLRRCRRRATLLVFKRLSTRLLKILPTRLPIVFPNVVTRRKRVTYLGPFLNDVLTVIDRFPTCSTCFSSPSPPPRARDTAPTILPHIGGQHNPRRRSQHIRSPHPNIGPRALRNSNRTTSCSGEHSEYTVQTCNHRSIGRHHSRGR